jgi:hypothetical protein
VADEALVTVECSKPGDAYTLLEYGRELTVHLAGASSSGHGVGPCICGFDRFARDETGHMMVGFSIGGGVTGSDIHPDVCSECRRLSGIAQIRGLHAGLFRQDDSRPRDAFVS